MTLFVTDIAYWTHALVGLAIWYGLASFFSRTLLRNGAKPMASATTAGWLACPIAAIIGLGSAWFIADKPDLMIAVGATVLLGTALVMITFHFLDTASGE